jgi:hypothetical protein
MPRDGAIIFGDLVGKFDMLRADCEKCGRKGRYCAGAFSVPAYPQACRDA